MNYTSEFKISCFTAHKAFVESWNKTVNIKTGQKNSSTSFSVLQLMLLLRAFSIISIYYSNSLLLYMPASQIMALCSRRKYVGASYLAAQCSFI